MRADQAVPTIVVCWYNINFRLRTFTDAGHFTVNSSSTSE